MFKSIGVIVSLLVVLFLALMFNAWAISCFWEWFLVPTTSLESLSFVEYVGLAVVYSYVKSSADSDDQKKTKQDHWTEFFAKIFMTLALLGIGWLVTLAM